MRGTGFVRGLQPTPERLIACSARIGAAIGRSLPDESGVFREPYWTDQGTDESCTAHTGVKMLYALTGVKCSPAVPWWAARLVDSPRLPLANVGVSAYAFLRALREFGASPETDPPVRVRYDEEPPALLRQRAQKMNLDVDPVWGTGDQVLAAMCAALDDGLPGGVVVAADAVYRHPVNGFVGPEVEEGHWHEVPVWRYRKRSDGSLEFLSPGSWGPGLGIDGCVWLHESRVSGSPSIVIGKGAS